MGEAGAAHSAEAQRRQDWMGACHPLSVLVVAFLLPLFAFANLLLKWLSTFFLQLSAIDVSARTTMKGAAKCDKHCELQDSVNQ